MKIKLKDGVILNPSGAQKDLKKCSEQIIFIIFLSYLIYSLIYYLFDLFYFLNNKISN